MESGNYLLGGHNNFDNYLLGGHNFHALGGHNFHAGDLNILRSHRVVSARSFLALDRGHHEVEPGDAEQGQAEEQDEGALTDARR